MLNFNAIIQAIEAETIERDISENSLAKELGIPQTTLNRIIRGQRRIGFKTLDKILSARPHWTNLVQIGAEPPAVNGGIEPEQPVDGR